MTRQGAVEGTQAIVPQRAMAVTENVQVVEHVTKTSRSQLRAAMAVSEVHDRSLKLRSQYTRQESLAEHVEVSIVGELITGTARQRSRH